MPAHNSDIANIFSTLADLLEIEGDNPFRIRAYREAARTIRSHPESMATLVRQGEDLSKIPTIGVDRPAGDGSKPVTSSTRCLCGSSKRSSAAADCELPAQGCESWKRTRPTPITGALVA